MPFRRLAALKKDRLGLTTLEFALVAPTMLAFIFAAAGTGLIAFYQANLDDAARVVARQLQIGASAAANEAGFLASLCTTFGTLASDCTAAIAYKVQASPAASGFAALTPVSVRQAASLGRNYFNGGTPFGSGVNILVQISYPMPFTLPFIGTLLTGTGTGSIMSTASVRVEPFS